jgi:AraC-like DNA-binding protein
MDKTFLPADDMQKPQYLKKSALADIGLKLYSYWILKEGYISTPADTAVHIAYILDGYGYYGDIKIKAGDVVAFGLNIQPIRFNVFNISMFIIDMDFSLFYSITGLKPSICRDSVFLDNRNSFVRLGKMLFQHPVKYWIYNIEAYVLRVLEKHRFPLNKTMERVVFATNEIDKERDFNSIANDLKISHRQLQRDFHSILGLSLKEYRSIRRFYGAAHKLKKKSILEVARDTGYCDQAHMNKEFKKKSGWTPREVSKHHYY